MDTVAGAPGGIALVASNSGPVELGFDPRLRLGLLDPRRGAELRGEEPARLQVELPLVGGERRTRGEGTLAANGISNDLGETDGVPGDDLLARAPGPGLPRL